MKNLKFLLLFILAFLVFWSCEKDPIDNDLINEQSTELTLRKAEKSKLQNRVVNSEALKDNFIGNSHTRKLQVYTPPGYKKNSPEGYPVVYLLHGFPFSEKAFIEPSVWDEWITPYLFSQEYPDFPAEGFRLWVDNLIEEEIIEPLIIVMPNAGTEPYGFSFYTNSALNGNFEDFIVNDLVSYMDKNYNTIPNASGRAVVGHSQGGYAAFKFGMLHPDIFGTIGSHSGLLMVDALFDPIMIDRLEQENQGGFTGPDPTKFLTSALYGMSAAWSPNLNNPPFLVDLPLEFHEDGHLYPVPVVVGQWYQNDVFSLLNDHVGDLKSLNIFFDVGLEDELSTHLVHLYYFEPMLQFLGVENYTFETYFGGHHTHMYQQLAKSLEFCSNSM